jgi:hypothetical protein
VGLVVVLAISALAAGGYHLHAWQQRRDAPPPPTLAGAPANTTGVATAGNALLMASPGKPIDPAELERFKAQEQAKGNRVIEAAQGVWIVIPGGGNAPGTETRP